MYWYKIVPKYSRDISNLEEKVISMYGLGMSTRDINKHIQEIYGVDVSAEMVSKITDKIIPLVEEWQNRSLEDIYYFTFLDAIHFNVKEDKSIVKKAAYVILGVNSEGKKDVLGIYIGGNESAKFWLTVLNDLKNRGVKDILIASVDGLTGFLDAIKAVYPHTDIQRCIIHQIRYTLSFVSYKEKKEFAKDLTEIYTSPNEETGYSALQKLKEKWKTGYAKDWAMIKGQLAIEYKERLKGF